MFETANHPLEITEPKQLRPLIAESIVIEDNVWLGARVTVVSGVTIGKGSVVAAGAVVTANVPPYTLVGGIPARVIKSIPAGSQTPATIASTPGENKTMPVADDPTAS
jgi:acetyltransferase-like isoleucine patch superfamily enzyme